MLGVDPDAEIDAVEAKLRERGMKVELRLRGRHFSALGFGDGAEFGGVRVATVRGIALALDSSAGTAVEPRLRFRLVAGPLADSQDADSDGFEEVFVERRVGAAAIPCLEVYRVRDSGFVDRVAAGEFAPPPGIEAAAAPWPEPLLCDQEAADAGSNGASEPQQVEKPATSRP